MAYNIGAGIADITDTAVGLGMQGMADPFQKTAGVASRLYARAFVIENRTSPKRRVAIVVADLWAGTAAVKAEVLRRLGALPRNPYKEANVLISGTHTHSAPGGYSDHKLYEHTVGGFDPHTFECVVSGMVRAIQNAHDNLAPGKIYINKGNVPAKCGSQRSRLAYNANPRAERDKYKSDTDTEMLLLKFVALDKGGELPLGELNWYAIHPTDLGQTNIRVSGDNKGDAASRFEKHMGTDYAAKKTFVAAFANANCGDVSGNVDFGARPDGKNDNAHMATHGRAQFNAARNLFNAAHDEVSGSIDFRHTRVDMSNVSIKGVQGRGTWPGGLGLAFAAGSTEDSVPVPPTGLKEGLVEPRLTRAERTVQGAAIGLLASAFGTTSDTSDFVKGHHPKPLILRSGLFNPPVTPNVLPLQLLKIGDLVLAAIPGEITTMAGRRLKETILAQLPGVKHLALATYANDYSQYITTKEEYDKQHYEGASTLFGPYTLMAYQQEFEKLAQALHRFQTVPAGPAKPLGTATPARRITIRNNSASTVTLRFFKQSDPVIGGLFGFLAAPFATVEVARNRDQAYYLPGDVDEAKVRINDGQLVERIQVGSQLTISAKSRGSVSAYTPPPPAT